MVEQPSFGDFVLGLEGLAILRSWIVDPTTVKARTQKIVEMAGRLEEQPWSNPMDADAVERTVTAGYAEWAATYDDSGNPILLAEEPVVRELLARYPAGAALDAACGTGRHASYMASLGHRVTGIDSTPEMLEVAAVKVPSAQFETADLTAIPLPDGAVDLAVCTLALTHCADLGLPIRELARVVRPGGAVGISDVHPFVVILGGHGSYRPSPTERAFVRNFVHWPSGYIAAFRAAGLNVVQCIEPLWGDQEISMMGFDDQMPDLMDAAIKGAPIVIVWELEKSA